MSHRSQFLGINQSPNARDAFVDDDRLLLASAAPPTRTSFVPIEKIVSTMMAQGVPVQYALADLGTGAGTHRVRVAFGVGPVAIPLDLTTLEARELAAKILLVANADVPSVDLPPAIERTETTNE